MWLACLNNFAGRRGDKACYSGITRWHSGKESACQCMGHRFLGGEDPPEKEMATYPVFLPGNFHGQRSLAGYSPWGHKEMWLSTHSVISRNCVWSLDKKHGLLGPCLQEQDREGNMVKPSEVLLILPEIKAAHIVQSNCRFCITARNWKDRAMNVRQETKCLWSFWFGRMDRWWYTRLR